MCMKRDSTAIAHTQLQLKSLLIHDEQLSDKFTEYCDTSCFVTLITDVPFVLIQKEFWQQC